MGRRVMHRTGTELRGTSPLRDSGRLDAGSEAVVAGTAPWGYTCCAGTGWESVAGTSPEAADRRHTRGEHMHSQVAVAGVDEDMVVAVLPVVQ